MIELPVQIKIHVNPNVFLKDPESSELGKNIVMHSIELLNEIGFEAFTFRKLGMLTGWPESTIYRYFESKHMLLVYLTSWYWGWIEYKLAIATTNIYSPKERLRKAIEIVTERGEEDNSFFAC